MESTKKKRNHEIEDNLDQVIESDLLDDTIKKILNEIRDEDPELFNQLEKKFKENKE